MRRITTKLGIVFIGICVTLLFCEILIHYLVVMVCKWPSLKGFGEHETLKALILADTHLLGPKKGHWFDKWRREKQMQQAFKAIIRIHDPEAIFVLGDLFDEGDLVTDLGFREFVNRFFHLFAVPGHIKMYVVPGNHDIGFHHVTRPALVKRFAELLNVTSVQLVTLKGVHIVLLNSIALHGDKCQLCSDAKKRIEEISEILYPQDKDRNNTEKRYYSKPIIMQHFPFYRKSDKICSGPNLAPESERSVRFRTKIDALSDPSTRFLMENIKPVVAFTAHTHHGCELTHKLVLDNETIITYEYSVPSFSWRNRPEPKYLLVTLAPDTYAVNICDMPTEISMAMAAVFLLSITVYIASAMRTIGRRQ